MIRLTYTQEELYTEILAVAAGSADYDALHRWLREHITE